MSLIFDIGCHWGHWIDKNYNRKDTFIGVEANKDVFQLTKERFALLPNVEIIHYLVSDKTYEYQPFYIANNSKGECSTASRWWVEKSRHIETESWREPVNVFTITLDHLISRYGEPDLIKIDTEGYENVVLKGLRKKQKTLCFEWCEEQEDITDSVNYLNSLGYEWFYCQHGDEYTFRPTYWLTYTEILAVIDSLEPARKQRWGMLWVS